MKERIITAWDIGVMCTMLAIAVLIYALFISSFWGEQPKGVTVFVDGAEYATYSFSEISETKRIEIKSDFGYNILEITPNSARITEASCKDKIDVQSGEISKPGQMLICAPNRVTVRITGENILNIDRVTY